MDPIIDKPSLINIRERKVLMVRSFGKDLFYIPGGKRERNETVIECLVREVPEEVRARVRMDTLKELFVFEDEAHGKPKGTLIRFTCIFAELEGDIVPSSEIEEARYFGSEDRALTPPAGVVILERLVTLDLID